jgi:tape measure domain-containing protein
MAETHELRLKINAAAAKAGSRAFVAAIVSIQRSVIDLDRMSDGTFKRLAKNAQIAGKAANNTVKPVDRSALRSLDAFAKLQAQTLRQTANTRRGLTSLMDGLRTVAAAYTTARTANEAYTQSVTRSNSVLARQAQLLSQTRSAASASGAGSSPAAPRANNRASDQQIAMQNRVKRAVDDTRLSVERLTTSLMKVGGFSEIQKVGSAFREFQRNVSGAAVSSQQLDVAKTKLNATMRQAQTAAVTLNTKFAEEARITKAAADAARQKERANATMANSAKAAATATSNANAAMARQEKLALDAASANRRASEEVSRLSQRLKNIGDTRGLAMLNTALNQFRSSTAGGVQSASQLRTATAQLAEATSRAKIGLTGMEGAQTRASRSARKLASSSSQAAANARRVEQNMRSIAGSSNAAAGAMRNATGSMRGLENAFSATFQIGSAFRAMIGSLTFGTFIQGVFAAGRALDQFRVTMEVATGTMSGAMQQMDFIDGMARELGTGLRGAREDFAKFAVSASLAGVETATARDIFRSVSEAMTVMGRGAEDQRLAFLALEQMLSKNVVSSEELRRQLGERLPGAVNLMARAVGVTTAELQDMLKAGELVASEVLPKFAREVDRAFGPGLEASLAKAPAALGRFRNEIEFFLSAIADSGFMDELAKGFDRLTQAMRSPEALDAALKLGDGLTNLAEIGFDFAEATVTNIDRVGAAAKAILGGIIVRQVTLMAGALLTGATRAAAAIQVLTARFAGSTAATTAHTAALTRDTAAENINAAATVRSTGATTAHTRATVANAAAVSASAAASTRAAGAMAATSRVAGAAAMGMVGVSRVLLGLAGPIGIGIAALSLLPIFFSDSGEAAVEMADDIEDAVRRAGASLDQLEARDYAPTSRRMMDSIVSDLETLDSHLQRVGANSEDFADSFGSAMQRMARQTESTTSIFARMEGINLSRIGIDGDALDGLRGSTRRLVSDTLELGEAALSGQSSWLQFYEQIRRTIELDPSSGPALDGLAALARANAEAELATAAHREQLTLLFGTEDDKAVSQFAAVALSALRAGEGFDELQAEISETMNAAPELASRYQGVLDEIRESFARGVSTPQIRLDLGDNLGDSADRIIEIREELDRTAIATANAADWFDQMADGGLLRMRSLGVPQETIDSVRTFIGEFQRFENLTLPIENLRIIMDSLTFPTEQATAFAAAVERQFASLAPAQQTYDNFRRVLTEVAQQSQFAGANMDELSTRMAAAARAALDAGMNAEDFNTSLRSVLEAAGYTSSEIDNMIGLLMGAATEFTNSARAGYDAEAGAVAAANGLDHVSNAAAAAAAQVRGVVAALAALKGAGNAALAVAGGIAEDIRFQASQRSRPIYERAAAEFVREQQETISDAFSAAESEARARGADQGIFVAAASADRDAALAKVEQGAADIAAASLELYNTEAWADPRRSSGGGRSAGGGGGGSAGSREEQLAAADATQRHALAMEELIKSSREYLSGVDEENAALAMLASGMTTSEQAARMLAQAQMEGVVMTQEQTSAFFAQIEAAEALNRALTAMANDPVNDWMDSVPSWREAGQQIETGVFDSLSNSISEMIKTGKFDFESLGEAILGTIADIIADKAVKELVNLFGGNTSGSGEGGFGLGGFLSDLFGNGGSRGDAPDPFAAGGMGGQGGPEILNAFATGGPQAAEAIRAAMVQAGQQVGQSIRTGGAQAGAQMGTQVQTAGTVAGTQMGTQVMSAGAAGGAQMNTQIVTGSQVGAQAMGTAISTSSQQGSGFFSQIFGGLFGGGGGGGGMGGIFGMIMPMLLGGLFSEGGRSTSPVASTPMPVSAFRHAPSYSSGTPNTSGIPAMLHDNEAVIPLSRGRKIPVEFGDESGMGGRGGGKVLNQTFNISTPDADSFRKSQKQTMAEAAGAGQRALGANG